MRRRTMLAAIGTSATLTAGCLHGGSGDRTPTPAVGADTTTPTSTNTPSPVAKLSVSDQESDGLTLVVDAVKLDKSGWLVVHPEAEGGGPNGGVTWVEKQLEAGSYQNISLMLDDPIAEDQTVYPMLHYEDPADGEFTFPNEGDPPVKVDGSPLVKPVKVTLTSTPASTPALSVSDQSTDGTTIVVDEAAVDKSAWLVVHPEADGGGPNGGVTLVEQRLPPGTFQDISLTLDSRLTKDQTVYPMLHYENPADGEFTFPEDGDPPVTVDGTPLVKPMAVTVEDGSTATVTAKNTAFDPMRLSIDAGTTVTWTNEDSYGHDVTAAQFHDKAEDWNFAEDLPPGESVSHTFDSADVYEYYCTIHGKGTMCGAVIVGDSSLTAALPCEDSDEGGGGY